MQINPQIFRAYDIRGLTDSELTSDVAASIGKAFGTWLIRNQRSREAKSNGGGERPQVIVGRDNRYDSDRLSAKLIQGLLSVGTNVTDIGLAVTPLVHFATIKYSVSAGVIVTASHNPKEFNGFRFDLKGAVPFYGPELLQLRTIIENDDFEKGIGQVSYRENIFEDYKADLKSRIKIGRPLKVVIDCGNGAASKFAIELFSSLSLEVDSLFCNLDGDFPYHRPDPEERINLENLRQKVIEEKADLGFAFDTDADRYGVADEKGNTFENDKMMVILAREILKNHPGSKVLCDIKSSYVLIEEIKKLGGVPLMIKTGHPYFRQYLKAHDDVFLGGELSSHTFIKDNYYGYDDGLYAAARTAEIVSQSSRSLSSLLSDVPHTAHTEEIKINCPDELKTEVVNNIGLSLLREGRHVSDVDGFRVEISPTAWFLIRASNTSPYLSLRFEAEDKESLLRLVGMVKQKLSLYPSLDISVLGEKLWEKTHNI